MLHRVEDQAAGIAIAGELGSIRPKPPQRSRHLRILVALDERAHVVQDRARGWELRFSRTDFFRPLRLRHITHKRRGLPHAQRRARGTRRRLWDVQPLRCHPLRIAAGLEHGPLRVHLADLAPGELAAALGIRDDLMEFAVELIRHRHGNMLVRHSRVRGHLHRECRRPAGSRLHIDVVERHVRRLA